MLKIVRCNNWLKPKWWCLHVLLTVDKFPGENSQGEIKKSIRVVCVSVIKWQVKETHRAVAVYGTMGGKGRMREGIVVRLQLMVKVAKTHTHTLSPVCTCQDSKASTSCLQAFSNWRKLGLCRYMHTYSHTDTFTEEKVYLHTPTQPHNGC